MRFAEFVLGCLSSLLMLSGTLGLTVIFSINKKLPVYEKFLEWLGHSVPEAFANMLSNISLVTKLLWFLVCSYVVSMILILVTLFQINNKKSEMGHGNVCISIAIKPRLPELN